MKHVTSTAPLSAPSPATTPSPSARIVALDIARFVAIVGMIAVHLVVPATLIDAAPEFDRTAAALAARLAEGNASTLFAVLGGCSIVLASRSALSSGERGRAVLRVVVRGTIVAFFGMILGFVPTSVVVVLVPFGVAMMCAAPFLLLPSGALAGVAVVLALAGGTLNAAVRGSLGIVQDIGSVTPLDLADPVTLLRGLGLTGMYPVVTWLPYMLVGMLLARVLVSSPSRARLWTIVTAGAGAFAVAQSVSTAVARPAAVAAGLPEEFLSLTGFGAPLRTDWWAQLLATPHTGTLTDMMSTAGVAVAVIGVLAILLPAGSTIPRVLAPIRAAGAAPLTAYTLHVVLTGIATIPLLLGTAIDELPWYYAGVGVFALHVVIVVALGALLARLRRRDPLEALVSGGVKWLVPRRR